MFAVGQGHGRAFPHRSPRANVMQHTRLIETTAAAMHGEVYYISRLQPRAPSPQHANAPIWPPAMHHFATQLHGGQQTTYSLRSRQYSTHRTRPRAGRDDSSPSPEPPAATQSVPTAQLRVAGLSPRDESQVPPAPFPHAPATAARDRYGASRLQKELAKPPVRLYAANASSKGGEETRAASLKVTHLNVLSTVMHRCLLEGDYERAGRAWGMLLRTQIAGRPVDPRNQGRWGVGAEILLHRTSQPTTVEELQAEQQALNEGMFSEEGFELARDYYRLLINNYPNRKLAPFALDDRTFYPAMFSLWIFEVSESSKRARSQAQDADQRRSRSMSVDSVLGDTLHDLSAQEDAIEASELARTNEIAERMDGLIGSPPFDKQANLLQLRGHVSLWRSSLLAGKVDDEEDLDMEPPEGSRDLASGTAVEHFTRLTACRRELLNAQILFQRAEMNGASRQGATTASIDLRLRELDMQLARLRGPPED
jgi:nucleoid-associated protein YgaU